MRKLPTVSPPPTEETAPAETVAVPSAPSCGSGSGPKAPAPRQPLEDPDAEEFAGYTTLASDEYLRLAESSRGELEATMLRGETPSLDGIRGWEFRGLNIAFWAPYSPIHKFIKGFYGPADDHLYGFNIPVIQNGPRGAWIAEPSDADPKRFGFYLVKRAEARERDNVYLNALLLNYGKGHNHLLDPSNVLRDYLVRVHPGSDRLLLGKAYLALGPLRKASNYFLLERHRRHEFRRL